MANGFYKIGIRMFIDPRQIFCYVGIAVRVGQRMGLHRDGAIFGLSPFEVEQRRRLWWTIVGYDRRIGEMTGSTVTALSTIGDTKLPLNINDTDLHIDGKEAPAGHLGPTEMLFSLIRAELAMAISTDAGKDPRINVDKNDPAAYRPLSLVRMAGPGGQSYTLDGFFAHIEGTYLRFCDQKIPLHFFTLTMTRHALCKMRVVSFLVRMANGDPATALNDHERETLFIEAIQMIEYDNIVQSAESLRGFKWYTYLHFPFPAYMFLVTELRHRPTGPTADRAWEAIEKNHELRGLMNKLHNPMHLAFGNLFVKAWDARDAASKQLGIAHQAPVWVERLRERAVKMGKKQKHPKKEHGEAGNTAAGLPPQSQQQPKQQQHTQPPQHPDQQSQHSQQHPGSDASMHTSPPDHSSLESSVSPMMAYPDMNNEFGDMNWGFFMQGYDMQNFSGYPPSFGIPVDANGMPIGANPRPPAPGQAPMGGHPGGNMYTQPR